MPPIIGPPAPCALCGTTGGQMGRCRPLRHNGARHGIVGVLCARCLQWLNRRLAREKRGPRVAVPCAACGTAGGYIEKKHTLPSRRNAARFGVDGMVCHRCYKRLRRRLTSHRSKSTIGPPAPCALCGTTGGHASTDRTRRPRRFNGATFGIAGTICHTCDSRLRRRRQAGTPLFDPRPVIPGSKTLAPCARCGTTGGTIVKGCKVPQRRNGARYGIDGPICLACRWQLYSTTPNYSRPPRRLAMMNPEVGPDRGP